MPIIDYWPSPALGLWLCMIGRPIRPPVVAGFLNAVVIPVPADDNGSDWLRQAREMLELLTVGYGSHDKSLPTD